MQWFLKEQVEEVATMSDLLRVVERSPRRPMDIEDYIARERGGEGADPTAPPPPAARSELAARTRRRHLEASLARFERAARPASTGCDAVRGVCAATPRSGAGCVD